MQASAAVISRSRVTCLSSPRADVAQGNGRAPPPAPAPPAPPPRSASAGRRFRADPSDAGSRAWMSSCSRRLARHRAPIGDRDCCNICSRHVAHRFALLSDVDGGERFGIGRKLAAVLRGMGLGVLLQQERHHVRLLRVRLDGVEGRVGEHLDAELMVDEIDRVELLAFGGVLLDAEQRADRRAERHDVAALDPDFADELGIVDRRIADRIGTL